MADSLLDLLFDLNKDAVRVKRENAARSKKLGAKRSQTVTRRGVGYVDDGGIPEHHISIGMGARWSNADSDEKQWDVAIDA